MYWLFGWFFLFLVFLYLFRSWFLNKICGTKKESSQLFVHYYICLFCVFLWISICLLFLSLSGKKNGQKQNRQDKRLNKYGSHGIFD